MKTLPMTDPSAIEPAAAGDARAAADLIHQTDPGVWGYLFRDDRDAFDRFATGLWERPDNNFSFTESVVVRSKGEPVALEMGYRGDVELELRQRMRAEAIGFLPEEDVEPLLAQARDIDYLAPQIPADAYYVHFLSVRPDHQGTGLGRLLLDNVRQRAGRLGCGEVHLDVYTDNPAVSLYRAFGFRIAVESRFPHKPGLPAHYRMVCAL